MDDSYPSKLQVWRGWTTAGAFPPAPPGSFSLARLATTVEAADRLHAHEAMLLSGARPRRGSPAAARTEPYTLQWFLEAEELRHGRNGRWIPRLLEFNKHAGEKLLGVGRGLGTDWVQYARNGASVVVCCPSADELGLTRRNFELRGLPGTFLQAPATALPVEAAAIDVVCLNLLPAPWLDGLIAPPANEATVSEAVVEEVYRVLKPGGKVLALIPARFDVDFWVGTLFPWQRWFQPAPAAHTPRYSGRALCRLFRRFTEHRVHKRHLRRSEVPHIWRWVPPALLARVMGRVLVLKAFKPLSAAMNLHMAA